MVIAPHQQIVHFPTSPPPPPPLLDSMRAGSRSCQPFQFYWMHAIFVLIITGVGLIFQCYRGLRQMYDDMQIPTLVINGPPAPLLPVNIGPPAPLPSVINGPPVPLPPVIIGPPAPLLPVINGPPAALPPVLNGAPAPRPQAPPRRSNRLKNKPVYHNMYRGVQID
ncbi:Hypothetical predicted protein [Mytilus galloprovincialis]|uniref:Uncharacterized protein n=1 Tax=Mytilus galloprovincialis TaxID=29158 RepID=A0A8B6EUV5_MYTGA|nr:Hypothetical predicted protein [Mytilus galloprovincialis]